MADPILDPKQTYASIGQHLSANVLRPASGAWWFGFGLSSLGLALFLVAIAKLLWSGVGIWGLNSTVVWGFDIINYVWWIGIGNAGTLISAIFAGGSRSFSIGAPIASPAFGRGSRASTRPVVAAP